MHEEGAFGADKAKVLCNRLAKQYSTIRHLLAMDNTVLPTAATGKADHIVWLILSAEA